jgi:regulator of cell morphogenesis and NO signaling
MHTTKEHQPSISKQKIGDIVSDNYHAAGVFKAHGIDFCCGGGRPLGTVCEEQGIDLTALTEELKSIPWVNHSSGDNYNDWSPSFMIDYIINTHHTFVRQKTREIPIYAAKVAKVHGERHPENVEIFKLFTSLSNELIEHLSDEEQAVFPLIKTVSEKRDRGEAISDNEMNELKNQLKLMIDDHEGAGQIMAKIRELSNDFTPPADACRTYRVLYQNLAGFEENLHKHVHLENNILFRKIERLVAA